MKKFFLFVLTTIASVGFFSCKNSTPAVSNQDYVKVCDNSPVDLSDVIGRYKKTQVSPVAEIDEAVVEGFDPISYGTPRADSMFMITDLKSLSNFDPEVWKDAYNGLVMGADIWSWFEVWNRERFNGASVNHDSIKTEILAFDASCVWDSALQSELGDVQRYFVNFIDLYKDGGVEETEKLDVWPVDKLNAFSQQLGETLPSSDSEEAEAMFYVAYSDWKEEQYEPYWQRILSLDDGDKQINQFFDAIQNAATFDQQCRMALCGIMFLSPYAVLPIARTLLGSSKYSPHLFVLWFGWRSATQITYYGRSRDSIIADELFNLYRRKAFTTVLYYADQHPEDKLASFMLTPLLGLPNIVRNGECLFGNDANIDYDSLFGSEE